MKRSRVRHIAQPPKLPPSESASALAAGMADDFNNILTTVMGACSLIDRDDHANSELLQYVALIRTSAEHAAALSDKLVRGTTEQQGACPESHSHGCASAATSVRDKKTNDVIVAANNDPGGSAS